MNFLYPVCRFYVSKKFKRTTTMNNYTQSSLRWVGLWKHDSGTVILGVIVTKTLNIL